MIARLCKDPELSTTQGGSFVCKFSVANNDSYTSNGEKKESVSFFNVVSWNKLAEVINQYCAKGSKVAIEGRLQQRTWQDKDGNKRSQVEIVADSVQFLDIKKEGSQNETHGETFAAEPSLENQFADDQIPDLF
jgi:single-strand DNA-binding protein